MAEIKAHPAYTEKKDPELVKAYNEIEKTKTTEEINEQNSADEKAAEELWESLKADPQTIWSYQNGMYEYNPTNKAHKLLNKFRVKFGIQWKAGGSK
jgi:glutamate/tyrosine decarboxylase-like PLP-dependent enzyme